MFTNKAKAPLPNPSRYRNFTQLDLIWVEITSLIYEVLRRLCSADFPNKLRTCNIVANAHWLPENHRRIWQSWLPQQLLLCYVLYFAFSFLIWWYYKISTLTVGRKAATHQASFFLIWWNKKPRSEPAEVLMSWNPRISVVWHLKSTKVVVKIHIGRAGNV